MSQDNWKFDLSKLTRKQREDLADLMQEMGRGQELSVEKSQQMLFYLCTITKAWPYPMDPARLFNYTYPQMTPEQSREIGLALFAWDQKHPIRPNGKRLA